MGFKDKTFQIKAAKMTTEAGSVVGQRFGAFTFTSQVGKKQNTKTWAKFQSLE